MNTLIFQAISVLLGGFLLLQWFRDILKARTVAGGSVIRWLKTPQLRGFLYLIVALTLPLLFTHFSGLGGKAEEWFSTGYAMLTASTIVAMLISVGWAYYLNALDVFEKERVGYLILTFALGCLSTVFIWPIGNELFSQTGWALNGEFWNDWWYCVIRIGALEELVKIIPFLLVLLFTRQVNDPFDYILYGSLSALGFAFIENVQYLQVSDLNAVFGRALFSSVAHMFDTSVICYTLVLANYRRHRWRWFAFPLGLILASFAHGFYDFWLISKSVQPYAIVTSFFLIATLQLWVLMKNNLLNISLFFDVNIKLNGSRFKYLVINMMFTTLAVTYVFKFLLEGLESADALLLRSLAGYSYVLLFISLSFSSMEIVPDYLKRFRFSLNVMRLLIPQLESTPNISGSRVVMKASESPEASRVLQWREGEGLMVGTLTRRIVMRGFTNWYLFTPDSEDYEAGFQAYAIRALEPKASLIGLKDTEVLVRGVKDASKITGGVLRTANSEAIGQASVKADLLP